MPRQAGSLGTRSGWNRPLQWQPLTTRGLQAPRFPGRLAWPPETWDQLTGHRLGEGRCLEAGLTSPRISSLALQLLAQLSSVRLQHQPMLQRGDAPQTWVNLVGLAEA